MEYIPIGTVNYSKSGDYTNKNYLITFLHNTIVFWYRSFKQIIVNEDLIPCNVLQL